MSARQAGLFAQEPVTRTAFVDAAPLGFVTVAFTIFDPPYGFDVEDVTAARPGAVGRRLVERLRRPASALYAGRNGCRDVAVCAVDLAPPERPLAYVDGLTFDRVRDELARARRDAHRG